MTLHRLLPADEVHLSNCGNLISHLLRHLQSSIDPWQNLQGGEDLAENQTVISLPSSYLHIDPPPSIGHYLAPSMKPEVFLHEVCTSASTVDLYQVTENKAQRNCIKGGEELTCKWLFTSSFVRPSTCISSLICLGVATANIHK